MYIFGIYIIGTSTQGIVRKEEARAVVLKFEPWGDDPRFEWDEHNEAKIWAHGIDMFEVEQCFDMENERFVIPHPKAKSEPEKYGDRYMVRGVTNGGRRLLITVQHVGGDTIRPITARDL